ncbi:MAG: FAD-dependent oxidoreductase [Chloroflexota bacterium]
MSVGIIGAGMTGLSAGRRLTAMGDDVVVLEKTHDPGGRVATRRLHDCVIDHGGQYLRLPDDHPEVRRLILDDLPVNGLVDIKKPVWTFDPTGQVRPGDPEQNAESKWTYTGGLSTLSQRLADGLDVRLGQHVCSIERSHGGYAFLDSDGGLLCQVDRALVTLPAPGAAALLRASTIDGPRMASALRELETVSYRPILSIMLGYASVDAVFSGGDSRQPRPYYALVNTDRGHPISWLAFENDKGSSRVPDGMLALVVQMGAAWSFKHFEDDDAVVVSEATPEVTRLLDVDLRQPRWHDISRWRYALPDSTCDLVVLNHDHHGLLLAGDYVAGGRIHLALQAGLDVAIQLAGGQREET